MQPYDINRPLISLHIPKCGGTSVSSVLRRWYLWNFHKHYVDEKSNRKPKKHNLYRFFSKNRFKRAVCIHGHFNPERGTGVKDYYPEADQFITFLRDPFEICVSNFFFVKKLGKNAYRDGQVHHVVASSTDLLQFLDKAEKSYLLRFLPFDITFENYKEILEKNFIYIGITEDMQTSVANLAHKLNFSPVRVRQRNISPRYAEIPEGARERFMEKNQLEYAVYQYALERYNTFKV